MKSGRFHVSVTRSLVLSLGVISLATLFIATSALSLLVSIFSRGAGDVDLGASFAQLHQKHSQLIRTSQDRFNNRSPFFPPPRTPRIQIVQERQAPPTTAPDVIVTPPPPLPRISFAFGNDVWFKPATSGGGAFKIRAGERVGDTEVRESRSPWSVKLIHHGAEHEVQIFEHPDLHDELTPIGATTNGGDS